MRLFAALRMRGGMRLLTEKLLCLSQVVLQTSLVNHR